MPLNAGFRCLMRRGPSLTLTSVVVVCAIATGCEVSEYAGDGRLVDNGPLAATDRYILDLGAITIGDGATHSFSLSGLPEENFVVGFVIDITEREQRVTAASEPSMRVQLIAEGDGSVFDIDKPIAEWTWSHARDASHGYVYSRDGAGTYFDAASSENYHLIVTTTLVERKVEARLQARSGGWK